MKGKRQGQRRVPSLPEMEMEERQRVAAKELAAKIKSTEQKIRQYRTNRYPEKSILQILRKIREQFGAFGEAVAIAMVRRNHRLETPDLIFIAEEEAEVQRLGQPLLDQNTLHFN